MRFPQAPRPGVSLLLLGLAAYATSFAGRFQFDDFYLIVNNAELAGLAAAWRSLFISLRPLTKLTLALNVSWHGLQPFGFHLVNLALHLFSGVLVYRIAMTVESPGASGFRPSWLATAIFLLHPAQTEAVTYISGRSTSLMTACLLLAHWLALRAEQPSRALLWRCASLSAFVAAVLAKEAALIYPLLYVIWLTVLEGRSWRQAMTRTAPYAALSSVLFLGLLVHPRYHALLLEAAHRLPWTEAVLSQARAVVALLGILVFPWRVAIDHALPVVHSLREAWLHLCILLAVVLLAVRGSRHSRTFGCGVLWGFAALLPTQSLLVRQDLTADRLLYLPMVGFSLAGADLLARLCAEGQRRLPKAIALWPITLLAVSLALGVATARRNLLYRSEIALWKDSVAKAPHNARAHHNLGYAYELEGDFPAAVGEYRVALTLQPENERYQRSLEIGLRKIAAEGQPPTSPPN